ncbi:helix-turn-helix domain-containing protein [Sediminimonas qiaohouensis]|uniref:helix-turn-helix domain-containing protein n=1 Tax=Sediminimonas qiaohouensis TaxID=552061 RepID=UPI00047D2315|nr:helix-turn-helix domain-containing protein [Sediminimonas qiaohouensis]
MPQRQLVGARIRERRMIADLRQSEVARRAGISASYLNLIEHNRRRIGGKLLLDIAQVLGVEPASLSEGAEAALITLLREARAADPMAGAEAEALEDFAGRFPGWARLLAGRHRRAVDLEHTVETLTDRLAHDPHLAAALHDMLSTVTAIRATAGILADTRELEPEWRDRFHRNINEDSARLANSSQALVSYLDAAGETDAALSSPQEELEAFLNAHGYHFDALENLPEGAVGTDRIGAMLEEGQERLHSASAQAMARAYLERYLQDARRLPLRQFIKALRRTGPDPAALSQLLDTDLAAVMRRLATLPEGAGAGPVGMVSCDASGTLILRKPLPGFALPRFGAACPLWPLFQALSRPLSPIRQVVRQSAREGGVFLTYAVAQPCARRGDPLSDPLYEAHMMMLPLDGDAHDKGDPLELGVNCRICPRESCAGRREPSILTDGF